MKTTILITILLITIANLKSQETHSYELRISNETSSYLYVKFYPVSMVFSGYNGSDTVPYYTLLAKNRQSPSTSSWWYDYNNGVGVYRNSSNVDIVYNTYELNANGTVDFNHDAALEGNNNASFGYGIYKVLMSTTPEFYEKDSILIDYDWRFGHGDNSIHYTNDSIYFTLQYYGDITINYASEDNYFIKPWKRWGLTRNFGDAKYDTTQSNTFVEFPLDSRADCHITSLEQNQSFSDSRGGLIPLNLTIKKNISTRDTLIDNPTNIVIMKKAQLWINSQIAFNMITPVLPSGGYTNLIVQDTAILILRDSAEITVNSPNQLTLKNKSNLRLNGNNAKIRFKPGSVFCNQGGIIGGPGRIIFEKGFHYLACATVNDLISRDSTKIVLEDSAVLVVPEDFTIKLSGKESKLLLNPYSKILFGENSKIVIDSSAKIIANNATFGPTDTTKTWDGIYCSNSGGDTIIACKIINAKNGINFTDKLSSYRSMVKDCEFINKTCESINSGINAYNSSKILIRGNHFYSETACNFDNAIYLEYCTSDELIVVDNTIENATNAIIDIGSWSYIARNTITGDEGSGHGITLDNYSGTIKYNSIENFSYSLYALVSDAYLYRNVFQNASDANLELESYSIPLLRPVQSDELKYWLGGDNVIDISGESVGINLVDESYPLIKDGYNKFYLNDADYFITGVKPAELDDSLEVRNNYWNASVNSSKFDIPYLTVKYSPTEDGSPGNRYYNTTFIMNLGFDVQDTLYIHDESDNPVITDLFLLGNNKVMAGDYEDAVEDFKEVVTSKDSIFTNLALKKVYYCYERSNFFSSNYTDAKNYFNGINTDTNYSTTSRAIARDLYLKVKFKNGEYESAEEEYNTIYENNIDNSLGLHALINKTILENLVATDNSGGSNLENLAEHKKQIFELLNPNENSAKRGIHVKDILANEYKLEQNYPNPFNPMTKINYSLPISGIVRIKVYDMLGKEVMTLVNEMKQAGSYDVQFNGSNLSSGIYIYKITVQSIGAVGEFNQVKKMVLIK